MSNTSMNTTSNIANGNFRSPQLISSVPQTNFLQLTTARTPATATAAEPLISHDRYSAWSPKSCDYSPTSDSSQLNGNESQIQDRFFEANVEGCDCNSSRTEKTDNFGNEGVDLSGFPKASDFSSESVLDYQSRILNASHDNNIVNRTFRLVNGCKNELKTHSLFNNGASFPHNANNFNSWSPASTNCHIPFVESPSSAFLPQFAWYRNSENPIGEQNGANSLANPSAFQKSCLPHFASQPTAYSNHSIITNTLNHTAPMVAQQPSKKRSGGRKPREEETQLPPEEEEKRRLRRLRNKEAAARCRKRRMDQMTSLEMKVNELAEQQQQMEDELEQLMQEKEHLEFILHAHQPICKMNGSLVNNNCSKSGSADHNTLCSMSTSSTATLQSNQIVTSRTLDPILTSVQVSLSEVASNETLSATLSMTREVASYSNDACGLGLSRPSTLPLSSAVGRVLFPSPFNASANSAANSGIDTLGRSLCLTSVGDASTLGLGSIPIQTPSKIGDFDPLNAPSGFTPLIAQASVGGSTFLPSSFLVTSQSQTNCSLETPVVGESKTNNFAKL